MKDYTCKICNKIYTNIQAFAGHVSQHDPIGRAARIRGFREKCAKMHISEKRICPRCNKEFIISVIPGSKRKCFQKKYCSVYCAHKYKRTSNLHKAQARLPKKPMIERWLSGELTGAGNDGTLRDRIRRYLIQQAGSMCSVCGWHEQSKFTNKIPLAIHHKDGNFRNNDIINLQVLCPNCHSLTEFFGSRNKGRGRPDRRLR